MTINEEKIGYEVWPTDSGGFCVCAIATNGYCADSDRMAEHPDADDILSAATQAKGRLLYFLKQEHRRCQEEVSIAIGRLATFEREVLSG